MINLDVKAGATYERMITIQGIDRARVKHLICKIRSKVTGRVIHDFGVIAVQPDNNALLQATPEQTQGWKHELAEIDIALVDADNKVWPSQTLPIKIERFISGA